MVLFFQTSCHLPLFPHNPKNRVRCLTSTHSQVRQVEGLNPGPLDHVHLLNKMKSCLRLDKFVCLWRWYCPSNVLQRCFSRLTFHHNRVLERHRRFTIAIEWQKIKLWKIGSLGMKIQCIGWYWPSLKSNHAAAGSKIETKDCFGDQIFAIFLYKELKIHQNVLTLTGHISATA